MQSQAARTLGRLTCSYTRTLTRLFPPALRGTAQQTSALQESAATLAAPSLRAPFAPPPFRRRPAVSVRDSIRHRYFLQALLPPMGSCKLDELLQPLADALAAAFAEGETSAACAQVLRRLLGPDLRFLGYAGCLPPRQGAGVGWACGGCRWARCKHSSSERGGRDRQRRSTSLPRPACPPSPLQPAASWCGTAALSWWPLQTAPSLDPPRCICLMSGPRGQDWRWRAGRRCSCSCRSAAPAQAWQRWETCRCCWVRRPMRSRHFACPSAAARLPLLTELRSRTASSAPRKAAAAGLCCWAWQARRMPGGCSGTRACVQQRRACPGDAFSTASGVVLAGGVLPLILAPPRPPPQVQAPRAADAPGAVLAAAPCPAVGRHVEVCERC